jgi:peptidoglycan hydrolase-like protein with peptidoglycan-binding domain
MNTLINNKLLLLKKFLIDSGFTKEAEGLDSVLETNLEKLKAGRIKVSKNSEYKRDNDTVSYIQNKLIDAGFQLPRWGADGVFGKETENAVMSFQNALASSGDSIVANGIVDSVLLDKLEAHERSSSLIENQDSKADISEEKETKPVSMTREKANTLSVGSELVMFGDSQMQGYLGKALYAKYGGKKFAKQTTTGSYWKNHAGLIKALRNAGKIIISLGGNGASGTQGLIKAIHEHAPDGIKVIWTGAPPPMYDGKHSYRYGSRQGYNSSIKGDLAHANKPSIEESKSIEGSNKEREGREGEKLPLPPDLYTKEWVFVNPYDYIEQESGKSGYRCGKTDRRCDGIHLPESVAKQYVEDISALI